MTGVDALIKRGIADPDRLVADGLERRRHLANKLVTMTDRFKAASSGAGIANWISLYAQTDSTSFRRTVVRRHAVAEERADRRCSGTTRRSRTWRT